MKKNSKEYESLKSKLIKLQALAERGYRNEANNAHRAIERICETYGVDFRDFMEDETERPYTFQVGTDKDIRDIFFRCAVKACNGKNLSYREPKGAKIVVKCTAAEFVEINNMFDWHRRNFHKELQDFKESFVGAYIHKHDLYYDFSLTDLNNEEEESIQLTKEQLERVAKIRSIIGGIGDARYRRQLEK